MPQMDPCYFCELIAAEAAAWNFIAQDELTVTLLNGRQFEAGQCVVVPRRHAPSLLDLTTGEGAAVMDAARRITAVMVTAYAPQGVLLYQNNGVGSGQEVPHFHLHVVPRRADSDWGLGPPHIARLHREQSPPRLDHGAVTQDKLATVACLRKHLE